MKRVILSALSILAFSSFAVPAALAESAPIQRAAITSSSRPNAAQFSPNSLVTAAFRGRFVSQGIPSSAQLHHAYASGRVTAQDLVRAAIAEGNLSSETLNDAGYLASVETKLQSLDD